MKNNSIQYKLTFPQKISYKLFITICISLLIGFVIVILLINSFFVVRANSQELSKRKAQVTTEHMVSEMDTTLESLRQFFLYSAMDEDVEWFLSNRFNYSDYDHYRQISSAVGSNTMFPNYVNSYVIINTINKMVISSKGIYDLDDMVNKDEVLKLYEENLTKINRGNWIYIHDGTRAASLDTGYRLTADTYGMNFILNLPIGEYTSKGFMMVNLNMDKWKETVLKDIGISGRHVTVLDQKGTVIFSNNSNFTSKCKELNSLNNNIDPQKINIDQKNYIISECTSSILGWNYYVAYDYDTIISDASKLLLEFLILISVLLALSFITIRYAIYQPVEQLIEEVSDNNNSDVKGNEFKYLAGQFKTLKNDKEELNLSINQKKEKLAELFEVRIIRSAVSSGDEWDEYIKVLNLTEYPYYALIAIILNLKDDEIMNEDINEDAICLALAENLPESLKNRAWLPLIYDSCTLTCILAANSEEELMENISSYYNEFKEYAFKSTGNNIQMGVSEVHSKHNHLGRAYHECVYALTMDMEENDSDVSQDSSASDSDCRYYIKSESATGESRDLKKYENEICNALKALDKGACYRIIDEFTDNIKLIGDWSIASVFFLSLINSILIQAIDMQVDILSLYPDGIQNLFQSIIESGDTSRVRKNLKKKLIDPIFKSRLTLLEDNTYQMMVQIEKKLADSKGNISLNQCADELNVTPTYIWKIMKAERGKTFSEYQEEYKIEEAKKLLQTDMSVSNIATELGYTNAQNFIRFFSKETGVTPGKYRKLKYGSL